MRTITNHFQHFTPLLGILAAGFLGFYLFSYDRSFQAAVAVATVLAYICWGVVHHYIHKNLSVQVVVEYLAIGLLGLVALLAVIFRG